LVHQGDMDMIPVKTTCMRCTMVYTKSVALQDSTALR